MITVLLADGFEEIEALTPVDMLRRAGKKVVTVGITGKTVTGAHGIPVIADCEPKNLPHDEIECLILPGGMPGTKNLDASPETDALINLTLADGGRLAAICAAPSVLGKRGLLRGKKATCYPSFERFLEGADCVTDKVVTDGNVTTSRGAGTAMDFALGLVALLVSPEKSDELKSGVIFD